MSSYNQFLNAYSIDGGVSLKNVDMVNFTYGLK